MGQSNEINQKYIVLRVCRVQKGDTFIVGNKYNLRSRVICFNYFVSLCTKTFQHKTQEARTFIEQERAERRTVCTHFS